MIILGIESSCDETSAALVTDRRQILSHIIHSQIEDHRPYGGVVPELGARAHLGAIQQVIEAAKEQAGLTDWAALDGIAVTAGPGLIGGLLVGVMAAKAMAATLQKPIIGINHLEGHALTARLTNEVPFPYLLLLVSGGHCQFLEVLDVGSYRLLGGTIDDAAGEAFDKVARCLTLPYPGGPHVEQIARTGDANRFTFPRPLYKTPGCTLSFSGLKTAVRQQTQKMGKMSAQDKADIAASFQQAVADCLADRLKNAIAISMAPHQHIVVGGGVAANQTIRTRLEQISAAYGLTFVAPPLALCTDNAAMIAWAGVEHFVSAHSKGEKIGHLPFSACPRWPLASAHDNILERLYPF